MIIYNIHIRDTLSINDKIGFYMFFFSLIIILKTIDLFISSIPDYTMKRRKMHAWGLLLVGLIMSSQINSGLAGRMGPPRDHQHQYQQQVHQQQGQQRQLQVVNELSVLVFLPCATQPPAAVKVICGGSGIIPSHLSHSLLHDDQSQQVQRTHPAGGGRPHLCAAP